MNAQRLKSSHEKFPVRAPRTDAHKHRCAIATWRNPKTLTAKVPDLVKVVCPRTGMTKFVLPGYAPITKFVGQVRLVRA